MSTQTTKVAVKKASTRKEQPEAKERKAKKAESPKTGSTKADSVKTEFEKSRGTVPASRKKASRQSQNRDLASAGQNPKTGGIKKESPRRQTKSSLLSPATRLLVFTAKTVGKGLTGMFRLAARIPTLFVRSTKRIYGGSSAK